MKKILTGVVITWFIALIVISLAGPVKNLINDTFGLLDIGDSGVFVGRQIDNLFDRFDDLLADMGR